MAFYTHVFPCGRSQKFASKRACRDYLRMEARKEERMKSGKAISAPIPSDYECKQPMPQRVEPVAFTMVKPASRQGGMATRQQITGERFIYRERAR